MTVNYRVFPAGAQILRCMICVGFVAACLAPLGCGNQEPQPEVVIYTSVDEPFARQVLQTFEEQTGIHVRALYDTEAGKTTNFLRRLQREADDPQADVWWSSEVFTSVELAAEGILTPYQSPNAEDVPAEWKDPQHRWTGTAARARVVGFVKDRVDPAELPETFRGYAEPEWAKQLVIANPQFGTTRGHVAAMFAFWGPAEARAFLKALREHETLVADGNMQAIRLVAQGHARVCFTDTDDVWVLQRHGTAVDLVYPKMGPDLPPMWIPCSVGLIENGPNPDAGRQLVDFLVSAQVERLLAESDSRNVPVRPALRKTLEIPGPAPQPLPYQDIADVIPEAMTATRDILLR